jgi:hypothetical protein
VKRRTGLMFWTESVTAMASFSLAVLTIVWRDWIEGVFGFDPDHHNGSAEWLIAAVLFLVAIICSVLARKAWRRAPLVPAHHPVG